MPISEEIRSQPLLLVGCGGIGCEVIKNLLLMGFNNIKMIDLDTIDVSNLNRQFLFNKTHINQSKALVSAKVASSLFANGRTDLNITPIHGSILSADYDVEYFKSFSLVINALDNRQARSHVNRMCLAADVPLIESGTEGYLGQTFLIKKNVTACYECTGPKADQKTFASCTIRNTPSLPIHCIVWGKHLFNQLFGEDEDPDNDVSPDMNDPELMNSNDKENLENLENEDKQNGAGDQSSQAAAKAPSTRKWAEANGYDPVLLFDKLFRIDIEYLHKMDKLWKSRTKPITLKYDQLDAELPNTSSSVDQTAETDDCSLKEQKILSLRECYELFVDSLAKLKERVQSEQYLVWDKDDEPALDFVTAVSNLRSICFHIERKSKFDVKSMAGNIIPAISSTNSIIGGLMVLQLINLLKRLTKLTEEQKSNKKEIAELFKATVRHVYLRRVSTNVGNLIASYECQEQNPSCMVCCTKHIPELEVRLNLKLVTMHDLVEQFIFKKLNFVCPDIQLDGQPTIIWSKDDYEEFSDGEKEEYKSKPLVSYSLIKDKVRLKVYDLLQSMSVIITLYHEEFTLNENDGLFYKMKITSESDDQMDADDAEPPTTSTMGTNGGPDLTNLNENSIEEIKENEPTAESVGVSITVTDLNSDTFISEPVSSSIDSSMINNRRPSLAPQETIDLESESSSKSEATNGKPAAELNGNHKRNESVDDNEIVLLDSDDEAEPPAAQPAIDQDDDNSGCELIDDDDIQMIDQPNVSKDKRKLVELDGSDEHSSKKPRIEHHL